MFIKNKLEAIFGYTLRANDAFSGLPMNGSDFSDIGLIIIIMTFSIVTFCNRFDPINHRMSFISAIMTASANHRLQ